MTNFIENAEKKFDELLLTKVNTVEQMQTLMYAYAKFNETIVDTTDFALYLEDLELEEVDDNLSDLIDSCKKATDESVAQGSRCAGFPPFYSGSTIPSPIQYSDDAAAQGDNQSTSKVRLTSQAEMTRVLLEFQRLGKKHPSLLNDPDFLHARGVVNRFAS